VEKSGFISHDEVARILRRVGYTQQQIDDVLRDFPDPIDLDRSREDFLKHGISLGALIDQMGGSP
jgi:CBS-domain-containing membrane protein